MFEKIKPLHTKVDKIIEIKGGYVVLESYSGYPVGQSNLYLVSEGGETVWFAERPVADAHYIRVRLEADGMRLAAYTTSRHACDIDVNSGKLLSQLEFK